jgi:hypothetical protein
LIPDWPAAASTINFGIVAGFEAVFADLMVWNDQKEMGMTSGPFLLPTAAEPATPSLASSLVPEGAPSVPRRMSPESVIPVAEEIQFANVVEGPSVVPVSGTIETRTITTARVRSWPIRIMFGMYAAIASFLHGAFGVASIIAALSVLASIPILNLLSLGYLLEVSGRVGKTGKISEALVGIHKASRVGSIIVCAWIVMLPARFLSGLWYDQYLLTPGSAEERRLWLLTALLVSFSAAYVCWAWLRGGRFRDFLWPAPIRFLKTFFGGKLWHDAANGSWDFVMSLRLPYYFSLGFRGFVGTAIWLALPIGLFIAGNKSDAPFADFFNFFGALVMGFVLIYLPFAQAHFAAENRFRAMFELRVIRDHFRRAPIFFWIALLFTVALALPLYLAKIEYIPRELLFLPGILFITFSFPARALTGWAMGYAHHREKPRFFLFRWASRMAMIPVALIYVIVLFFSQYTSWNGVFSLFEQHAFLVPAPFLSN